MSASRDRISLSELRWVLHLMLAAPLPGRLQAHSSPHDQHQLPEYFLSVVI